MINYESSLPQVNAVYVERDNALAYFLGGGMVQANTYGDLVRWLDLHLMLDEAKIDTIWRDGIAHTVAWRVQP